jgi:hypothetical protein
MKWENQGFTTVVVVVVVVVGERFRQGLPGLHSQANSRQQPTIQPNSVVQLA